MPDERDRDRDREAGRLAGLQEAFNTETRNRFQTINGSIHNTAVELRKLGLQVQAIREELARRDLVNEALVKEHETLGAKKLSRLQMVFVALGALVAVGGFALAVAEALVR